MWGPWRYRQSRRRYQFGLLVLVKLFISFALLISTDVIADQPTSASGDAQPDRPEIVMSGPSEESSLTGYYLNLVFTEAFDRLNYTFIYRFYPHKRARGLASAGKLAGELARFHIYSDLYPEFKRVEEPLREIKLVAYSSDPNIQLQSWKSLRGQAYQVEHLDDSQVIEMRLKGVLPDYQIHTVSTWEQGFKRLLEGRSHLFISPDLLMDRVQQHLQGSHSQIYSAGVMEVGTVHAFLAKHYWHLAEPLSAVLKQMKQEGLLAYFARETERYISQKP